MQVLSDFALSLEKGVKKYDRQLELEKKAAKKKKEEAAKEKGKENRQNTPSLLRASSLQPHVGVTDKVKGLNTPSDQGTDPMNALFNAIKKRGSQKSNNSIPSQLSSQNQMNPKQALLESIKGRRESLPVKSPADGVSDRVRHINDNTGRKESRVLLVNRMLSEAPARVRQDFLKGVTYQKTDDPLLRKIYEKEDDSPKAADIKKNYKPIDPRQELFAAIRNRNTEDD